MEAIKIIIPAAERKPCVCGATLYISRATTNKRPADVWLCERHCGARGLSYEGALRRKVRLDLLRWGDLRVQRSSTDRRGRGRSRHFPAAMTR